jgi:hypothetical protein
MHDLVALFLGVITLLIILLVVGLAALQVLIITPNKIMASILSMMIVRLAIVAIALVALMIVSILVAMMLLVALFTAMCGGKMSHFLFFWLPLILGNLHVNASHFVGCLTLLEESDQLEWVSGHHLVQDAELEFMCLGLHEEDLFILFLRCGYFHCLMEVAILKIAEKLYSMTHELVHRHESGLLGSTKPANQLVAYIGEPGDGLGESLMHLLKFTLVQSASLGHHFAMTLVHLVKPTSWKH